MPLRDFPLIFRGCLFSPSVEFDHGLLLIVQHCWETTSSDPQSITLVDSVFLYSSNTIALNLSINAFFLFFSSHFLFLLLFSPHNSFCYILLFIVGSFSFSSPLDSLCPQRPAVPEIIYFPFLSLRAFRTPSKTDFRLSAPLLRFRAIMGGRTRLKRREQMKMCVHRYTSWVLYTRQYSS